MGRPEEYTEEKGVKICELMTMGMSLRSICELEKMPCKETVFKWLAKHETFLNHYARAREAQMECHSHELTELADNASLTAEAINKARLQIDTRKWVMSKLKPKKYGDNTVLTHTGTVQVEQLILERPKTIDHVLALAVIDVKQE